MRKIVISLLLFMSFIGYSQTNGITYQALILNPTGEQLPGVYNSNAPLANKFICLKFTIIDQNSQSEYIETARTTTDEFGMVNLIIGTGERIGGYATSFSNVLWNANPKSLKVELSATGTCYTYVEISNQPFTAVPFALFAVNSQSTAALAALQATVAANATATTAALALKEDAINKSTTTTLGTSNVLFPTQNAVKTYVDTNVSTINANNTALQATVTTNATNTTTALATKENAANKSTATALGTSDVLFPTQNAVKTYVDNNITTVNANTTALQATVTTNATNTTAALATKENAANKSTTTTLGTSDVLFPTQNAVKTYVDINITSVNANNTALQATVTTNATATTTALATKENAANKSTTTTLGTSDVLFPTQNAVKTYVDAQVASATIADADATTKGKIQLAGDLTGTAAAPVIANNAIITAKIADATVTDPKIVGVSGSKVIGNISGSAANVTGIIPVANGGTGSSVKNFVDLSTAQTIGGAKIFSSDLKVNGLTFGKGAGSNNGVNTAIGASALEANTTGAYNSGFGFQALFNNTTGSYNHALGFQVLAANTTGDRNNAFGQGALPRNTTGSDNIAIGTSAMFRNTTANDNIAIGTQALGNSLTGSNNVAIGSQTLTGNSTGSNNTAVGYQSLKETSGSDNTALGRLSLMSNSTGNFNTAVGSLADVNSNNLSNTTAIGYGARVLANNTIQLGADGSGFVTNGVNTYTTAITNVRTSGTLTLKDVTYPNANGTAGQVLTANNNGNATWTTIASVADASTMTGTVAIDKGGTGATTATAALTNLGAAPIASPTFTGTVTSPIYASAPQTLTDAATISWNPSNGLNASVTLGGNRTLNFTTNPAVGSYGTLVITQDATGGRTITLPSTSNKVLGSASTTTIALSSAANAKDILNFYYDGTNCYWNIGQGYGTAEAPIVTNLAFSVSGTLAVANGGTGATTLTGIVKGNGTSALTAAVAGTDYQAPLTLTTTGSGAATLSGTTLNIPATTNYSLPTASASALGGVKVGTNLSIDGSGVLSTSATPNFTGSVTSPIFASTPQALTDAATISWNPSNGLNASVTLAGNRTLSFTATPTVGSYGTLVITQDGTGGRTITLPSTANKVLGSTSTTTVTLSSAAGAKDILNFYYDGTNCYWNVGQGYGTAATAAVTNLASSVSGTLAVANGGTGATTLTGYVKGTGTSAMTANATIPVADVTGAAPLASPSLTGTPTAPTATTGTNTTQVATTAFVAAAVASAVRLNSDEISATAAQTSFTLTQTPLGAKVWMFVNGVRIRNAAYSISGTTITYTPANNNSYAIVAGDRIQFDYAY